MDYSDLYELILKQTQDIVDLQHRCGELELRALGLASIGRNYWQDILNDTNETRARVRYIQDKINLDFLWND